MRGMLNGEWYEIEEYEMYFSIMNRPSYTIKDDPERGVFEADDFEEIEYDER